MRSEQQHIDKFFQNKEEAHQPETGSADRGWAQMKASLKPATEPGPKKYRVQKIQQILKYVGGFTVVTIITIVAITTTMNKKKGTAKKPAIAHTTQKSTLNKDTTKPVTTTPSSRKQPGTKPTIPRAPKPASTAASVAKTTSRRNYTRASVTDYLGAADKSSIATIVNEATQPSNTPIQQAATVIADNEATPAQLLSTFYQQLQKEGQHFTIDVNKDTVLTAREGTRLSIPAYAFANKRGQIKQGTIQIVLREYYTYEDIVSAKITTTSGGEQLISGGMVHISATADSVEANIATGKNIKLEMPTGNGNPEEKMQLFTGIRTSFKPAFQAKFMENRMIDTVRFLKRFADENGDLNWTPEGQEQKIASYGSRKIKVLQLFNEPYHVTNGGKMSAYYYVAKSCPYTNAQMEQKIRERSSVTFDEIKIKRVKQAPLKRNSPVKDELEPIVGDSVTMTFGEALRKNLLTCNDSCGIVNQIRQESKLNDTRDELYNAYSFQLNRLGWINCDRFNNDKGPKVLFTYKPDAEIEASTMVARLVFNSYRSVLPGEPKDKTIVFGKVPKDVPVTLVMVGLRKGKIVSSFKQLSTGDQEISNLEYEETTPEQFKEKLNILTASFQQSNNTAMKNDKRRFMGDTLVPREPECNCPPK